MPIHNVIMPLYIAIVLKLKEKLQAISTELKEKESYIEVLEGKYLTSESDAG